MFLLQPMVGCATQLQLAPRGTLPLRPPPACCATVISLLQMEPMSQKLRLHRLCSWKLRCGGSLMLSLQAAEAVPLLPGAPVLALQLLRLLQMPQCFNDEQFRKLLRGSPILQPLLMLQVQRSDRLQLVPLPCCQQLLLPQVPRQLRPSRGRLQRRSARLCAAFTAATLPSQRFHCLLSSPEGMPLLVLM